MDASCLMRYIQPKSTTVHVEQGLRRKSGCRASLSSSIVSFCLGIVSRMWTFSRRSFCTVLFGRVEAVIACCTQPSLPDGTPVALPNPRQVIPRRAACCSPKHCPTNWTLALKSTLCALCSVPVKRKKVQKRCQFLLWLPKKVRWHFPSIHHTHKWSKNGLVKYKKSHNFLTLFAWMGLLSSTGSTEAAFTLYTTPMNAAKTTRSCMLCHKRRCWATVTVSGVDERLSRSN